MPCYSHLRGWVGTKGKWVGDARHAVSPPQVLEIPCGKCIGCRLEKNRQWACRIMHEASLHDHKCFVTLTYRDEELPWCGGMPSLQQRDLTLFLKRARKRLGKLRYFACGEYGETTGRPHFHAILFGQSFQHDRKKLPKQSAFDLYRSPTLEYLWPYGHSSIGDVTFESAAYCARYTLKKLSGEKAANYYGRKPEFGAMSRNKGIGNKWIERYTTDVYPHDEVSFKGRKQRPPRYYDRFLQQTDAELLETIKLARQEYAQTDSAQRLREPLKAKTARDIAEARAKLKKGTL